MICDCLPHPQQGEKKEMIIFQAFHFPSRARKREKEEGGERKSIHETRRYIGTWLIYFFPFTNGTLHGMFLSLPSSLSLTQLERFSTINIIDSKTIKKSINISILK
jgi:hypothetical protein